MNKTISNSLILFCILSLFACNLFAEQLSSGRNNSFPQSVNPDIILALNETTDIESHEHEHPFRRFEITFFISAPFTFIISFISLSIYDTAKDSYQKKKFDGNVNVWKEYKYPLLIGTFGLSTAIASREAYICFKTNKEQEKDTGNNQKISLSVTKKF